VRAQNPESGSIEYQYDESGNLHRRKDGVRSLTYDDYDGMNRAKRKSYDDGKTNPVAYTYGDQTPGCQTQGGGVCGRLVTVATTAANGDAVINSYSAFDIAGRVKASSQQIGTGTPYNFTYDYDLSGALASVQYPSQRMVTNAFDAAGRICGVSLGATASCTGVGQYVANVLYAPQGAVAGLTLGNAVNETWSFNLRQQPTGLTAVSGATTLLALGWGYGADASNNGNV
jgi:hypothetical protein